MYIFKKLTCRTIMVRIKLFVTQIDVFLMSFLLFSCNFCTFTAGSPYMGTRKLRVWHVNLERFCELKQMLVLIGSLNIIAIEIGGVFCSVRRSKMTNLAFTASLTIICSIFTIQVCLTARNLTGRFLRFNRYFSISVVSVQANILISWVFKHTSLHGLQAHMFTCISS